MSEERKNPVEDPTDPQEDIDLLREIEEEGDPKDIVRGNAEAFFGKLKELEQQFIEERINEPAKYFAELVGGDAEDASMDALKDMFAWLALEGVITAELYSIRDNMSRLVTQLLEMGQKEVSLAVEALCGGDIQEPPTDTEDPNEDEEPSLDDFF